ncbi:n-acetyltransferase ESCO1 [Caerostris extrusa]|uniref:N-acetyltransferase ESCO1 n=1 Tax=Caerostris extrusa TaxID=172846 RepID=A0AAV4VUJ0_CAEEX|nr:n-acetyltransferase ESCO1 [Caerostris extrusa]
MRELRNIKLSNDFKPENIPKKQINKSKGLKKANKKVTPKRICNEKVIKKVFRSKIAKESLPELQCSISDLIGQHKNDCSKEKKFFKSRSPQHLKKAKFVMPLTCKKNLMDFGNEKKIEKECEPMNLNAKLLLHRNDSGQKLKNNSINMFDNCMEIVHHIDNKADENEREIYVLNKRHSFDRKDIESSNISPRNNVISKKAEGQKCKEKNLEMNKDIVKYGFLEFEWPSDKDLLERRNIARAKLRESLLSDKGSENEFYPIFSNTKQKVVVQEEKQSKTKKCGPNILDTSKGDEQMIIDAGQKKIGATTCKTCCMIYCIGQEEDEKLHSNYHQTYLINLRFPGWKKENVVGMFPEGRIIQVRETDKNFNLKKIQDILFIVNKDLGFPTAGLPVRPNVMILLFVSIEKRVVGCLVAESIDSACRIVAGEKSDEKTVWKLGSWYASSEPHPAICGINRIWVSHDFRRHKVASRMVDCLRRNFIYGHIVDLKELAFTDPSPEGRDFAAFYTGTDYFLVYK